jgi:hypothetical protein
VADTHDLGLGRKMFLTFAFGTAIMLWRVHKVPGAKRTGAPVRWRITAGHAKQLRAF